MKSKLIDEKERLFITGASDPASLLVPTFVKAGAGAGKTSSIKENVLNQIIHHDISPKDMVIITYTVKAAEELGTRIRGAIEEKIKDADTTEADRAKLMQALSDLPLARISTVHSFCRDLLVEYPVEFLVDPSADIVDERGSKLLEENCINEYLKHYRLQSGEYFEKYKSAFSAFEKLDNDKGEVKKVFEAFGVLYSNRDLKAKEVDFTLPNKENIEAEIYGAFCDLIEKLKGIDSVIKDKNDPLYQVKDNYLDYAKKITCFEDLILYPYTSATLFAQVGAKTRYHDPDFISSYKADVKAYKAVFDRHCLFANAEKYKYLVEAFKGYRDLVDDYKKEHGVLDFFDCLIKVNDTLKSNSTLLKGIQKKFKVLIIDEFQDSDPIQSEIAFMLAQDNPGKLFFVGDGKQSIYGFARADIEVFRSVEKRIVEEYKGVAKELSTNFRSSKPLLDYINSEFSLVLAGDYTSMHVAPVNAAMPGATRVIELDTALEEGEKLKAGEKRDREAYMICSKIKSMIDTGEYRPEDFLLLFRKSTPMDHYEKMLEGLQVPVTNTKSKEYLKKDEAMEVLAIMGLLIFPNSAFYQEAARGTSFFNGELPEFLSEVARSELGIKLKVKEAFKEIGIEYLCLVKNDPTYLELIEYLLEALDIELKMSQGHLEKAYNQLLSRAQDEGFNMHKESDEKVYYEGLAPESVRLMTIHASKGLESKVVFLIAHGAKDNMPCVQFVDRETNEVYPKNHYIPEKALETYDFGDLKALVDHQNAKRLEEEKRVLYVALTRAKSELYLTYNKDDELGYFLEPIEKTMLGLPERESFSFADYEQDFATLDPYKKEKLSKVQIKPFDPAVFKEIAVLKEGTPAVTTLIENSEIFRVAKLESRGMEFGNFAHEAMEVVCHFLHKGRDIEVEKILTKIMELKGYAIPSKDVEALNQAIEKFLAGDMAKVIKEAKDVSPEINFALPKKYHGIIDLLIEKADGSYLVIDFKTDVLASGEAGQKIKDHYKKQVGMYVDAVKEILGASEVKGECFYLME